MASPPAWLDMRPPQQPLVTTTLRLGAGEREALSLAQELHADLLLLDDLEAREEAERLAFAVMGTLRVLELASERGLLDFAAAITKLRATSFHMPAQLLQDMLARDAARKKPT
jgi:predicted nucleic acid-binding protein